jgi:pSer/pThr/pTyr-binding forkhead associated (FHA) protein
MAKLVLQFDDRALRETVVAGTVTIGRLPDNTIAIDNPAVSARHARVIREGDQFVVEDLESTNGTFVAGTRITRHVLRHGDVVLIGKHKLFFDKTSGRDADAPEAAEQAMPDFGGTVMLGPDQQRRLLAAVHARIQTRGATAEAGAPPPAPVPAPPPVGLLRVLDGRSDDYEFRLDAGTVYIGKSDAALIRLRGWFKPKLAAAITRLGEGYLVTPVKGRTMVNGQRLDGRRGLEHGDILEVGGLRLEFRLQATGRRAA